MLIKGINIRNLRINKGVTLFDMAKAIKVPVTQLSSIENDKFSPSWHTLIKISDFLGVNVDVLLSDEEVKLTAQYNICAETVNIDDIKQKGRRCVGEIYGDSLRRENMKNKNEFYIFGELQEYGGKDPSRIVIEEYTKNEVVTIEANRYQITKLQDEGRLNLYRAFGCKVYGKVDEQPKELTCCIFIEYCDPSMDEDDKRYWEAMASGVR